MIDVVQQPIKFGLFCLGELSVGVPGQEVIQAGLLNWRKGALGQRLEFGLTQSNQELGVWGGETGQLMIFF